MLNPIFSRSGGLGYHLRALKYRKGIWAPFVATIEARIEKWLDSLNLESRQLILIGHSGGYSLPLRRLKNFNLILIDPDPISHWIFNFRINGTPLHRPQDTHLTQDLIIAPVLNKKDRNTLSELLKEYEGAPILFCNFWGQVGMITDDSEPVFDHWRAQLPTLLKNRPWMSYHDRLFTIQDEISHQKTKLYSQSPSIEELLLDFLPRAKGVVEDHGTFGLFPESHSVENTLWEITPKALHVVEILAKA